jgi:hypothetical protein
MRTVAALLIGLLSTLARGEEPWTFVWVGTTDDAWIIVEGLGTAKLDKSEIHFDLTAKDTSKYIVDAVMTGGRVEAGFAGVDAAYRGITILKGTHVKRGARTKGSCGVEMIQIQNEYNSLSIKRRLCDKE